MPGFTMADMAAALEKTIGRVPPNGHATPAKSPRLTVRPASSAPAPTPQEETTPMPPAKTTTTVETPEQELARLKAENEALKARASRTAAIRLQVSEKGALSVYGLGRFPTTLYKEQWLRLLDFSGAPDTCPIRTFIAAHPELKTKEA